MPRIYDGEADFAARITTLTAAEGGRNVPPFNKMRWDFKYPEDDRSAGIYMIHPLFLNDAAEPIAMGLPIEGTVDAHMYVVDEEMRPFHAARLSAGSAFQCVEGNRVVALGQVTALLAIKSAKPAS